MVDFSSCTWLRRGWKLSGHGLEGQAKEGPKARLEGGPRSSKANTSPRGYSQLHPRCIALFFEPEFKVRRADQAKTQKVATVEILELAVVGSIHGRDDPTEAQAGPMVAGQHANLKPVGDELDPVGRHLPLSEGLGAVKPRPDRIDWAFDIKGAFEDMALKPLGWLTAARDWSAASWCFMTIPCAWWSRAASTTSLARRFVRLFSKRYRSIRFLGSSLHFDTLNRGF